jgi:hypothetical protein
MIKREKCVKKKKELNRKVLKKTIIRVIFRILHQLTNRKCK